ncbi:hypothetical protein AAFF_G00024460 [Aldrovandia affinis]|uniref:Uncharacterized protein n=1 Tax=Aldrovandia affinis TaxID=143900 RepID=A0AAD7T647_9TELE|nr:hypothetical protein AAFF_G00024460 [Aldrovandia affinis]
MRRSRLSPPDVLEVGMLPLVLLAPVFSIRAVIHIAGPESRILHQLSSKGMVIPALPTSASSHTVLAEAVPNGQLSGPPLAFTGFLSCLDTVGSYLDDMYSETPHPP